jgi:hypothetical protein
LQSTPLAGRLAELGSLGRYAHGTRQRPEMEFSDLDWRRFRRCHSYVLVSCRHSPAVGFAPRSRPERVVHFASGALVSRSFRLLAVALSRRQASHSPVCGRLVARELDPDGITCEETMVLISTRPNHALQRTRRERRGCKRTLSWAGSLSLGRWALFTRT